jgi:hypothetical protein
MRVPKKVLLIVSLLIAGCDDDDNAALQGGGPGYATPTPASDVVAGDNGFCGPQGGTGALGSPSFNSGVTTAKLDLDGNPAGQGVDPDWDSQTTGTVNGQPVNSAQYNYVVMSRAQMQQSGVGLGDWATVTNTTTGQSTYARVEDVGPFNGIGEISQATATAVGIQQVVVQTKEGPSTVPVGNPTVDVEAYAGTSGIEGNCQT